MNMDRFVVTVNGIDINHVGKTFMPPYIFPTTVISQIEYDKLLSVSCEQNVNMHIFNNADVLYEHIDDEFGQGIGAVYVSLEFMAEQHICVGAMAITMRKSLTESARIEFENKYQALGYRTFIHPELSNWSQLTHEMVGETVREMWAVEIIMFACMMNQLIFWEIFMRRLRPVMKRCHMVGGSNLILKSSLILFLTILAITITCLAIPLYALCMNWWNEYTKLSVQSAVSASIIWVLGLVGYCLLIIRDKEMKGR